VKPLVVLLCALLLPLAAACGEAKDQASAGQADLPALTGRVVDDANLVSSPAEAQLTRRLAALEARTTDQLVVVTVPSLRGEAIEQFGVRLSRGWGIGQKDKNNGVLLVVAPDERKVRIEVGYGLETVLTDPEAARIIRTQILPHFREGKMELGIVEGVHAILAVLDKGSAAERKMAA
jgi:uncharacterized protein